MTVSRGIVRGVLWFPPSSFPLQGVSISFQGLMSNNQNYSTLIFGLRTPLTAVFSCKTTADPRACREPPSEQGPENPPEDPPWFPVGEPVSLSPPPGPWLSKESRGAS